jgi:tetratricopeptide (TPR) repeat protein
MTIPIGPDSSLYSVGAGGTAHATISLFNFFAPGIQTGIQIQPLLNVGNSLTLVRAGVEANFYLYPVSRLYINGGGAFGSYIGTHPNASDFSGLYWSAHADVGFRFSPAFTLSAETEYRSYLYVPDPVFSGLSVGISAQLQLGALSKKTTGVTVERIEEEPVFPILYTMYDDVSFGTVRIINNEQAELRNVKVYFQGGDYTSRELLIEEIPFLRKGAAVEVPLYALFNEEILAFSENTKVEGEILVTYTFLNADRETRQSQSISIYHRNAARWQDDNIVAAFISPNDPAVLEYSKFIAGIVREKVRSGINDNLQYGMGLFEGLRLSEIAFTPDPSTPYQETRNNKNSVDYIQYPYQTIAYKGGERDDIGLLYAAALESVGIHAAYVPLQDEFLVAVDLNMDEETARSRFYYDDELIYVDGKAWVPIQVSRIKEGFMRAWIEGNKLWKQHAEGPEAPPFIKVTDAWKQYPSVGVFGDPSAYPKPRDDKVIKAFENSLYRYIKREVDPQAEALTKRFGPNGGDGRDFNRMGILYATYSLLPEAEEWFLKALKDDYMPAAVNLGNVAFLKEDYEASVRYFSQALEYRPSHRGALIGLARAKYELDVFTEADELYRQIKEIDPELAERYSYLSSQVEGSVSRASSAADRKGDLLWDEQE